VVCNAGAGTVDIIAHKIVSLDPLHVREAVPGIGKQSRVDWHTDTTPVCVCVLVSEASDDGAHINI